MPFVHKLLKLYVSFIAVSENVLLKSGASHNFIVVPLVTIFSNSLNQSLFNPVEPIKVHLANFFSTSYKIMYLTLKVSDGTMHTVEFRGFFHFEPCYNTWHAIFTQVKLQY